MNHVLAKSVAADEEHVSTEGLSGTERSLVEQQNSLLDTVKENGDPLCFLIAKTRWLLLELNRTDHAKRVGIARDKQRVLEDPEGHSFCETYSKIYRHWESVGVPEETLKRFLQLLIEREYERRGQIPMMEKDDQEDEEHVQYTIHDVYRIWRYQCGGKKFEHASMAAGKKTRLTNNLLRMRRERTFPSYNEVREIGGVLKRDVEQAEKVWLRDRQEQLQKRGIAVAYARFLALIEVRKVSPLFVESLVSEFNIPRDLARAIATCKPVTFEKIKDVAKQFLNKTEFDEIKQGWVCETETIERETFRTAFTRIRDAAGLNNHLIAEALQIKVPEYRGKSKTGQRSEGFKPSHVVRGTYKDTCFSTLAPAGALVEIVARPDVMCEIEGVQMGEREYLRRLFCLDRVAMHQRKGSAIGAVELRQAREFWGVGTDHLIGIGGLSYRDLLLVEKGTKPVPKRVMDALVRRTITIGQRRATTARKCREALDEERMRKQNANPRSVEEFVEVLAGRVGGQVKVITMNAPNKDEGERAYICLLSFQAIGVRKGKQVLPWPVMKKIVRCCGAEVLPELEQDWFVHYPHQLHSRDGRSIKGPLARGVLTAVGHHIKELNELVPLMSLSPSAIYKPVQQLEKGKFPEWPYISRMLAAIGMGVHDPIYRYLNILHQNRGKVPQSLSVWKREICKRGLDPKEYEYKLGLRDDERQLMTSPRKHA